MKLHAALLGIGLAAVQASPINSFCPTKCIDGITNCNQPWGGCWNICNETQPTPPECTKLDGPYYTVTPTPTPTSTPHGKRDNAHKPTPTSSSNCSTRTVCADYINECGLMYGGCFPDCLPWPTFTPPPCPSDLSTTATATPPPCAT